MLLYFAMLAVVRSEAADKQARSMRALSASWRQNARARDRDPGIVLGLGNFDLTDGLTSQLAIFTD